VNRHRWLESAEWLSLLGLVIGSVAAVGSGQVVYACVPVFVAICLNLVNRSQFERLTQHRQQQILQKLEFQGQQITEFNIKLMTAEIAKLQEQYSSLQQAVFTLNYRIELLTQSSALDENLSASDPNDEDDEDIDALLDTFD